VQAAELRRDEELAGATTAYNDFQLNLATAGDELKRLEGAAHSAFRGYGKFRRLLAHGRKWLEPDLSAITGTFPRIPEASVKNFRRPKSLWKFPLPKLFKFIPIWLVAVLLLGVASADPVLAHFHRTGISHLQAGAALAGFFVVAIIFFIGGRSAAPLAKTIGGDLARMRRQFDACLENPPRIFSRNRSGSKPNLKPANKLPSGMAAGRARHQPVAQQQCEGHQRKGVAPLPQE